MSPVAIRRAVCWANLVPACLLAISLAHADDVARPAVLVKIRDEQAKSGKGGEFSGPVDPVQRIRFQPQQQLNIQVMGEQGQTLHLSHFPGFNVDGQFINPMMGQGRFETLNAKLPKAANGKDRIGFLTVYVIGDLRLTQTIELVPTRPTAPGQKSMLDAVMIRYVMENKGNVSHKFGLRVYMDCYIVDNDGALFAAPTVPNKVLDGVELKDKTMPDYLQIMQRPDLKNPGYVAHVSMNLGSGKERPNRVIMTRHGLGFQTWEMMAAQAGGDSAMGIYWDPIEVKGGSKREVVYAYGKGLAIAPESEGNFNLLLGGSFEPGKLFTVSAYVQEPAAGQYLKLELPPGMERIEGKEIQPVAPPSGDRSESLVLWKARVARLGQFQLRVVSSTGLTQTKEITISAVDGTK